MDLNEIREQINGVDRELLPLFLKRMELSSRVAVWKAENGMPVYDAGRERQILSDVSERAGEEMAEYARLLYGELFSLSRAYQTQLMAGDKVFPLPEIEQAGFPHTATVACQGVEGAYSQAAADRAFRFADIRFVRTFDDVFEAVEKGSVRFGVLPIENSAHGSVTKVYDLMRRHRFTIVRAVKLHVRHHLLAVKGAELSGIRTVLSHEQALGQCSAFLAGLPDVQIRVCENTAVAAQLVARAGDRTMAAISSEACAAQYGLTVLRSHIQNTDNNYTRFIIIEKTPRLYPGATKLSLLFSLPDRPGALNRIMARFAAASLNLTKLESRPDEGSNFHYVFYADLEADPAEPAVRRLLLSLSEELPVFVFLGAYQEV